jgi:hypothetical protein
VIRPLKCTNKPNQISPCNPTQILKHTRPKLILPQANLHSTRAHSNAQKTATLRPDKIHSQFNWKEVDVGGSEVQAKSQHFLFATISSPGKLKLMPGIQKQTFFRPRALIGTRRLGQNNRIWRWDW